MTSRERILAKVRAGIRSGLPATTTDDEARRATVAARLAAHARHPIPARTAGKSGQELAALLRQWVEAAGGEVIEVASLQGVPGAVADFLRRRNLPMRIRSGADGTLAALPWSVEPHLTVEHGRATPTDAVGVSRALAAVAETGTLVLASGQDNPVTLTFLPESHIVVVDRGDVVGPLEDAIDRLRSGANGPPPMPRTLNLVSGPSRSADIGGVPVLGAHGPRRFAVVLVG